MWLAAPLWHLLGSGYRGADRRGILVRLGNPAGPRLGALSLGAVVVAPLAGVGGLNLLPELPVATASVAAADAALVAFLAAGLGLLLRWRLAGEASSALLGVAALVAGFLFVPAAQLGGTQPGYATGLQAGAVVVMVGICVAALRLPEVWAGLRPTLVAGAALGGALGLAVPLSLGAIAVGAGRGSPSFMVAGAIEGGACALLATALLVRGVGHGQTPLVAAGAALLAIAADCGALAALPLTGAGPWYALPSFLLLVGAVQLLGMVGLELSGTMTEVVLHDVRGRRRWAAAESELTRVRRAYRGQSHDVTSMLSAVDGTLLVLADEGHPLPAPERGRLLAAVRDQIQQLRAALAGEDGAARAYDLSSLLREVAALHGAAGRPIADGVEPALHVHGHPDRVARIVNNLLANAAAYAPGARVTLSATRNQGTGGAVVEIAVADDGPGLQDAELGSALEPGWRGGDRGVAGSGLGLSQCHRLAAAEGGEIVLGPTHPAGAPGAQGLTARVRIPARQPPACTGMSSSILQMRIGAEAATPSPEVPERALRRHVPWAGRRRRSGPVRAGPAAGGDPTGGRQGG